MRFCPLLPVLLLFLAPILPATAAAAGLNATGTVAAVADDDSFELRLRSRRTVASRLHAIDAPELAQPHGEAAGRAQLDAIGGRPVHVECYKRDTRGRHVCRASVGGDDLQLRLLQQGHAWHLAMYLDEQSTSERSRYARAQALTRAGRRGLWAQARPMPPWNRRQELRRLRPWR